MVDRTRRRVEGEFVPSGVSDVWNGDGSLQSHTPWVFYYPSAVKKRQVTIDEVHEWPARNKGRTTRDVGGPFTSTNVGFTADWDVTATYNLGNTGKGGRRYIGNVVPSFVVQDWQRLDPASNESLFTTWSDLHGPGYLEGLGARAISATIPTNPHADTAVGVAELMREGLPKLIGSTALQTRAASFRSLGSEYLNFEFGWKPFVSDLLSIASSIDESEKLLSQLARDSGKNVRRRMSFPVERNTTYTKDNIFPLSGASSFVLSQVSRTVVERTYHRSWFSGAYTYHYDPAALSEASRIATQARLLLGLKIDPEVLWNLAPWSWLVDWFVNIGPVLHNLSAFSQDGLVLRYGYLMHHHTRRTEITHHGITLPRGGDFPRGNRSAAFRLESKRRIRATPYGFGLTFGGFTVRQFAILAALGITRAPGVQ